MVVSLFLRIFEVEPDFEAINRGLLFQQFIEILLNKLRPADPEMRSFDFAHKVRLLAMLARRMSDENRYSLHETDWNDFLEQYFQSLGMRKPDRITEDFIDSGVLVKAGGELFFRFRVFEEYFCAQAMMEDPAFKKRVLDSYLSFANEIDFFTGLKRNTLDVLEYLGGILQQAREQFPDVDIRHLDKIEIDQVLVRIMQETGPKQEDKQDIIQRKDAIVDTIEEPPVRQTDAKPKPHVKSAWLRFFLTLTLYARVLRNCEFLPADQKSLALQTTVLDSCTLLAVFFREAENIVNTADDSVKDALRYFVGVWVPLLVQTALTQSVGNPKLEYQLKALIESASTDFVRFMALSVYSDLELPNHLQKFKEFLSRLENPCLQEICLYKLLFYYHSRTNASRPTLTYVEEIIADLGAKLHKYRPKERGKYMQSLRKGWLNRRFVEGEQ